MPSIIRDQLLAQARGCAKREDAEYSESMSTMSERKGGVPETDPAAANGRSVTAAIFIVRGVWTSGVCARG